MVGNAAHHHPGLHAGGQQPRRGHRGTPTTAAPRTRWACSSGRRHGRRDQRRHDAPLLRRLRVHRPQQHPGLVGAHLPRLQLHRGPAATGSPSSRRRDVTIERVRFDEHRLRPSSTSSPTTPGRARRRHGPRQHHRLLRAHRRRYTSWLLAAYGAAGSTVRQVSIIGNTITGNPTLRLRGQGARAQRRRRGDVGPREDFVVRDNTSTRTVARARPCSSTG